MCVCLKAINKDIAYIDTCFGFESAVESTQDFIEEGYALCKSNFNSVCNSDSIQPLSKFQGDSQVSSPWMLFEQLETPMPVLCHSFPSTCTGNGVF